MCVIHDKPLGWNAFDARGGTSRGVSLCASRLSLLGDVAAFLHAAALLQVAFSLCVFLAGAFCAFLCGGFVLGVLGFGGSPGYALGRVAVFGAFALCLCKGKAL